MDWIKHYFEDLFMSDATLGLDAFDDDGRMRSRIDSDGSYVLVVRDSRDDEYDDDGKPLGDLYEIRIRKL